MTPDRISRPLGDLVGGQRGMTGLETAIILIAFVTVAAVLACSVLSAGIYTSERDKAAIYQGLESAQASTEVVGSVLGLSPNQGELEQVAFTIGLALQHKEVDINAVVINYHDELVHSQDVTFSATRHPASTERGSTNVLEGDEQFVILTTVPEAANRVEYDSFTLQMTPPTGATLTITRSLPANLDKVMDLQ